ncbi:MAG TPA: 16S rRNA (uracil(1498)-N(3))-methyltransferase [Mycobacteriales bacterium]|nr:16S rRNA (uracil(1498)-N(3))-methyltransferase [Mycobacteriales bacterium]
MTRSSSEPPSPLFLADRAELLAASLVLGGAEGRHAAQVRRLRPGAAIELTDGAGLLARGTVAAVTRDAVTCTIEHRVEVPPGQPRIVVVQALAKGGRDEDAVAAMTEVGVDVIVPWVAARSVAQWKERSGERWVLTARAAAKQSRRAWVPEIAPLASTAEVAGLLARAALPVVLHESAQLPLASVTVPASGDVVLVVGPEGGLSPDELEAFDARCYRLGPTVLRTSTAGVVGVTVLLAHSARWLSP